MFCETIAMFKIVLRHALNLCSYLEYNSSRKDWGLGTVWFMKHDNASPIIKKFMKMLVIRNQFQTIHYKTNKLKEDKDITNQQLCCFSVLEL
jgi:hypothetical protein